MITVEKLHALQIGPEWVEPLNATIQKLAFLPSKSRPPLSDSFHTSATTSEHWKRILTTEPKPFKLSSILTSSQRSTSFLPTIPRRLPTEFTPIEGGTGMRQVGMGSCTGEEAQSNLPFTITTGTVDKLLVRIL